MSEKEELVEALESYFRKTNILFNEITPQMIKKESEDFKNLSTKKIKSTYKALIAKDKQHFLEMAMRNYIKNKGEVSLDDVLEYLETYFQTAIKGNKRWAKTFALENYKLKPKETKKRKRDSKEDKEEKSRRLSKARTEYNEKRKIPEKNSKERKAWEDEYKENQEKSLAFRMAFMRDVNASIAKLQQENLLPRTPSRTEGGPVSKQYLRFCGAGKKLELHKGKDDNPNRWVCEKDSYSEKSENYASNYGPVKKEIIRSLTMDKLKALAYTHGIGVKDIPKKDLVDLLYKKLNSERGEILKRNTPKKNKSLSMSTEKNLREQYIATKKRYEDVKLELKERKDADLVDEKQELVKKLKRLKSRLEKIQGEDIEEIKKEIRDIEVRLRDEKNPIAAKVLKTNLLRLKGKLRGIHNEEMGRKQFKKVYKDENVGLVENTEESEKVKERNKLVDESTFNALRDAHLAFQQDPKNYRAFNRKMSEFGALPLQKPNSSTAEVQAMPYCGIDTNGNFFYPHISINMDPETKEMREKITCRKKIVRIPKKDENQNSMRKKVEKTYIDPKTGRQVTKKTNQVIYSGKGQPTNKITGSGKRTVNLLLGGISNRERDYLDLKGFKDIITTPGSEFPGKEKISNISLKSLKSIAMRYFSASSDVLEDANKEEVIYGIQSAWNSRSMKESRKRKRSSSPRKGSPKKDSIDDYLKRDPFTARDFTNLLKNESIKNLSEKQSKDLREKIKDFRPQYINEVINNFYERFEKPKEFEDRIELIVKNFYRRNFKESLKKRE